MYTTDAIVLKKIDVGEHDALYMLYTEGYGKMRAVAAGIKKPEAKLRGHLEPLSLSRIRFVTGKNRERIIGASLLNFWDGIRGDARLPPGHAACSDRRACWSSSETSTRAPSAANSPSVRARARSSRSKSTTCAPSRPSRRATALPSPSAPPVTTATWPSKRPGASAMARRTYHDRSLKSICYNRRP